MVKPMLNISTGGPGVVEVDVTAANQLEQLKQLTPKPCLAPRGCGSDDTRGPGRPTGPLRGLSVFQVARVGCVYTSYARFPSSFRAREGLTWRSRFPRHVDVMKRVMRSRRDGQPNA